MSAFKTPQPYSAAQKHGGAQGFQWNLKSCLKNLFAAPERGFFKQLFRSSDE